MIFDDRDFPFDDSVGAPDFGPITDLRAAFEIRTGAATTAERLAREWPDGVAALWTTDDLAPIVADRNTLPVNTLPKNENSFFLINGRWAFPGGKFNLTTGQALIEKPGGAVVAAQLSSEDAQSFLESGRLADGIETLIREGQLLVRRPWELIGLLPKCLLTDLLTNPLVQQASETDHASLNLPENVTIIGNEALAIHPTAKVYPSVIFDIENGPVLIDAGATIRPGAIIQGPTYIGPHSTVLDQALIKSDTVVGPVCKVAGEVGHTIFQAFANKAHDGHLGDSYVGEWVNFGAGTTNSNLLNTYGEITAKIRPGSYRERTGLMYLGAIVGDHVKCAINTRIMTGTVIGTGAMITTSTPPPSAVEAFSWTTDQKVHLYRWEKFIQVCEVVMARRNVALTESMRTRLHSLHAKAAGE